MAKNEVLTPEVLTELPLEKVIDQTLVKNNVTNKVIAALKTKYGGMALTNLTDKEGYLNIKEARKEVRKIGIITENLCKAGREDAIKTQKAWLAKEKEILGKIAEVQDPLDAEIKKFDDEQARLDAEEAKRVEERFMQRSSDLLKLGAVYANGCYNLNEVSYESNMVKESDDEIFTDTILPKYKLAYEKNEAVKVEEEKKKQEAADELKKQQNALAEQQRQFNEQQELFKKQQDQLRLQQEEADRKQRAIEEEQRLEKNRQEEKLWRGRLNMMEEAGWNGQYAFSRLGSDDEQVFTYEELISLSEPEFTKRLVSYNEGIAKIKQQQTEIAEKNRLEEIELTKQQAIKAEQDRVAEEQRLAKIKAEQEEVRRAEELAKASDKEKWSALLTALNTIAIPEFKSSIYKSKLASYRQKAEEINNL